MKYIKGFESYMIRRDGAVYSIPRPSTRGGWIKPRKGKMGYWYYVLVNGPIRKTMKVHRLVGLHYLSNPNGFKYLNHIDADLDNNNDWNLEWCTASHNIKHAVSLGRKPIGSFYSSKVKDEQMLAHIRSDIEKGLEPQWKIGKKYGIAQSTVSMIKTGKTFYKHRAVDKATIKS